MRRALKLLLCFALIAPHGAVLVLGADAWSRPTSTLQLELLWNGTPSTPVRATATFPTAGTLTLTAGMPVQVQCDVAVDVFVPGVVDGGNGERLAAGSLWRRILPDGDATVSFLPVSGAAVCMGWTMR